MTRIGASCAEQEAARHVASRYGRSRWLGLTAELVWRIASSHLDAPERKRRLMELHGAGLIKDIHVEAAFTAYPELGSA